MSERITGRQLAERTTVFGDKLEIYFNANDVTPFAVVVNDLTSYPCVTWKQAENLYEHLFAFNGDNRLEVLH